MPLNPLCSSCKFPEGGTGLRRQLGSATAPAPCQSVCLLVPVFTAVEWGPCNTHMGKLSPALRQYERDTPVVSWHGGGLDSSALRGCLTQLLAAQMNGVAAGFPPSPGGVPS